MQHIVFQIIVVGLLPSYFATVKFVEQWNSEMWLEIFKTGVHKDSSGEEREYSAENLDEMVSIYNKRQEKDEKQEAPLVKGHPKSNDPAFGWVKKLARRGKSLWARVENLNSEIITDVRQGKYKKLSISIYPDNMLRHVGLLGAAAPAVKDLENLNFSEDLENERMIFSGEEIQSDTMEFSEEKYEELEEEKQNLMLLCKAYQEEIETLKRENKRREYEEFADSLIDFAEGPKIMPAQREIIVDMMEKANEKDEENIGNQDYSEDESNLKQLKSFFNSLSPIMSLNEELSTKKIANNCDEKYEGRNVNEERLEMHNLALEYMSSHPEISYEQALELSNK